MSLQVEPGALVALLGLRWRQDDDTTHHRRLRVPRYWDGKMGKKNFAPAAKQARFQHGVSNYGRFPHLSVGMVNIALACA
jgi:hypothetical protein